MSDTAAVTNKPDRVDRIRSEWAQAIPGLDTSTLEVTGRILSFAERVEANARAILLEFGLGIGDFSVLVTLRRVGTTGGLSPGQITDATMVTAGATTQRLARLEAAALVERRPDLDDQRRQHIYLTRSGTTTAERAMAAVTAAEQELLTPISDRDRRTLATTLKTLNATRT